MTSIYNRATPSQARILRIVEGAVKNAADAHPNIVLTKTFARSVAKRAAGTLTAGWPEVLATVASSDLMDAQTPMHPSRGTEIRASVFRRGPSQPLRRSPLRKLWGRLSYLAGQAARSGQTERYETIVEILRIVAEMQNEPSR